LLTATSPFYTANINATGRLCANGTDSAGGVWQVWAKPIASGATAVLLLNRNASASLNATVDFRACNVSKLATAVTDLWSGEMLGRHDTSWSAVVAPHAHRLIKIAPPAKEL
jgi:hypothetical protein